MNPSCWFFLRLSMIKNEKEMSQPNYRDLLMELGLSITQIDDLLVQFNSIEIAKGQHFLKVGDVFDDMFILTQGALRFYYLTPDGDESNKLFLFENDLSFPVAPIARDKPSLFGIVACENTRLSQLPFHQFKQRLLSLQVWDAFYLTYLEWLADAKIAREHHLLTSNKSQLIEDLAATEPQIYSRISDYHIASYLGMSPVTFSRLKRRVTEAQR